MVDKNQNGSDFADNCLHILKIAPDKTLFLIKKC